MLFFWPVRIHSPFLRKQHCLINFRTFHTVSQIETFLLCLPFLLRTTVLRSLPALLPFTVDCEPHLPKEPFLLPSNPPCHSFLYKLLSPSPFSSPDAIHHLCYILSFSAYARISQADTKSKKFFNTFSSSTSTSPCSAQTLKWSDREPFRPG